jgi:hypothetical protein
MLLSHNEAENITFCDGCSRRVLSAWRGWPLRDEIPMLPALIDGGCAACGGNEPLLSTEIGWINIHEEGNTGLPNYWVLDVVPLSFLFRGENGLPNKWGLPYWRHVRCRRCGNQAIESLLGRKSRVQCSCSGFIGGERKSPQSATS